MNAGNEIQLAASPAVDARDEQPVDALKGEIADEGYDLFEQTNQETLSEESSRAVGES